MITLADEEVLLPTGRTVQRTTVHHPGATVIVPITAEGQLLLTRQWRHTLGTYILEFPAGCLEAGEEPLSCAQRELAEEVAVTAASWTSLGRLYPSPGYSDECLYLYCATELSPCSQNLDDDEIIEPCYLTKKEFADKARNDDIFDAKTLAIFYRAQLYNLL